MSLFEEVDSLQREWTDRFVQVDGSVAELRRFAGLTGQVKTVNMSGQALVEFDGSEDIGWYDIHPQFLTVVEVEEEVEAVAETAEAAPAEVADEAPAPEAAPVADTSKLSPLELARMQDVGKAAPAAASVSVSVSVSKTPAAKKEAAEKAPAAAAPAKQKPAAPKAADTSKLSPLELARMQDIGGDAPAPAAVSEQEAVAAEETPAQDDNAVAEPAPAKAPAAAPAVDTSKLSPLELARMQDAGGDAPAPAAAAEDEAVVEETPAEDEEVAEEVAVEEETTAEETAADDSPATSVEIPEDEGPERTAAVLAACRAQDG